MIFKYFCLIAFFCSFLFADNVVHPGTPTLDRPTLTALGIVLPITGDDNFNASVAVQYRVTGTTLWYTGLPLFRVHAEIVVGYPTTPQFAGTIFNLRPGMTYDIQLQVTDPDGSVNQAFSLSGTTRAVPGLPATPNYVNVSDQTSLNNALQAAQPGDVITMANGTYTGPIYFFGSGTAQNPIIIQGASETGTIVDGGNCTDCNIWEIYGSYIYLETMTLQNAERAVRFQTPGSQDNVVRWVTTTNTTLGIGSQANQLDYYICDNILQGQIQWPLVYGTDGGLEANDDGINMQGFGHVVCHNTISGFGDAMKTSEPGDRADDFYGNDILWTYDNGIELDLSQGNTRCFRNRFTNTWDTLSVQPIFGGPAYIIQNIVLNAADEQMKFHSQNTVPIEDPIGIMVYHNTFYSTQADLNLNTPNTSHYFDIENNLFIGVESSSWNAVSWTGVIDHGLFDYDGYFPDGPMTFDFLSGYAAWSNFAGVQAGLLEEPHGLVLNGLPFETPIQIPASWMTFMTPQDISLAPGSSPVDRGLILPNINEGYTGTAPDLGAQEVGCPEPIFGPRPPGIDESNEPFGCPAPASPVSVALTSANTQIAPGQTNQFTATVAGSSNQAVTWTLTPFVGTISSSGLYTAPASSGTVPAILVTATSVTDSSKSAVYPMAVTATAGTPTALPVFNTGVTSVGVLAPDGSIDTHYTLVSSADPTAPGPATYVANSTEFPIPPWMGNGPNSKWLTPSSNAAANLAQGTFVYQTTFDLTGFDSATAQLTGQWSTDNFGYVLLNGATVGFSNTSYAVFTPIAIYSGFVSGVNTLQFAVDNFPNYPSPTGLRVELSGTALPVALPVTVTVKPSTANLGQAQKQQFTATVSNTSNTAVTWTLNPVLGTVSSTGLYTAPASITAQQSVTLTATSAADTAASATATITLNPPSIWSNGYSYRRTVTINASQITNRNQTNFPFLFSTTDPTLRSAANGGHVTSGAGFDIIFTSDAQGKQKLSYETEVYSAVTGQLTAWVKLPLVSYTANTVIYLFYGDASVTKSQQNRAAVWNSAYVGVWHLPNGTKLSANDSTANAHHGTITGATATVGEIGGAANFPGGGSSYINIADSTAFNVTALAVEAWVKLSDGGINQILDRDNLTDRQFQFRVNGGHLEFIPFVNGNALTITGTIPVNNGHYHHVAATWDGVTGRLYVDGVPDTAIAQSGTLSGGTGCPLKIGTWNGNTATQALVGAIDEPRFSNAALSADWIGDEYRSESSPGTFYTLGPEVQ
jgi:hypothetical protein